jgi:hypothetical protein
MKITRDDLKRLLLPIAVAAVLIAAGVGCLAVSDIAIEKATKAHDAAKLQRAEAQKRVAQRAEEERQINLDLVYYRKMVERGMVGTEDRLSLIDLIAKIKNENKLFDIRYNIEPQKPLDYAGISRAGSLDLVASRVKLNMLLLHEGDLLRFLDDLQAAGKSYVAVRRCAIERIERAASNSQAVVPRLESECQIDLIALKQVKPA